MKNKQAAYCKADVFLGNERIFTKGKRYTVRIPFELGDTILYLVADDGVPTSVCENIGSFNVQKIRK